jgi:putrescine transport system ATP-binding protein
MSPPQQGEPFVRIQNVTKKFGEFTAVDDVSIDIMRGELFALLGGSGCGKTTLLRMLAGFETPTSGTISIDGQDMTGIPPYERPVNMMFQSYALFPHMSVEQNIGYGLKHETMTGEQRKGRVKEMLELVKLDGYGGRKPHQLSGGQRQRVALARALYGQPALVVLDEPNANLDDAGEAALARAVLQLKQQGSTVLLVTHRPSAIALADRLLILREGRILMEGPRDAVLAALRPAAPQKPTQPQP